LCVLFDGSFIIAYKDYKVCIWKDFEQKDKIDFTESLRCVIPTTDGFVLGLAKSIRYFKNGKREYGKKVVILQIYY
jgi:hypothetical protein